MIENFISCCRIHVSSFFLSISTTCINRRCKLLFILFQKLFLAIMEVFFSLLTSLGRIKHVHRAALHILLTIWLESSRKLFKWDIDPIGKPTLWFPIKKCSSNQISREFFDQLCFKKKKSSRSIFESFSWDWQCPSQDEWATKLEFSKKNRQHRLVKVWKGCFLFLSVVVIVTLVVRVGREWSRSENKCQTKNNQGFHHLR